MHQSEEVLILQQLQELLAVTVVTAMLKIMVMKKMLIVSERTIKSIDESIVRLK
jgi:hypothetical protein